MPDELNLCPRCSGALWVVSVNDDGIAEAVRCECFEERRKRDNEKRAQIPLNYAKSSFENFNIHPRDTKNPIASSALSTPFMTVNKYAKEYPLFNDKPGLLLLGETGTGKTHLAVATLRYQLNRGFEGIFFDYQTLLEQIQRGWNSTSGTADREAYRLALDSELLVLDDLGARRAQPWVEDTIASIITHRCNNRLPLVATTNLPDPGAGQIVGGQRGLKTLAEVIGERARSRLFEMCHVVQMPNVDDYRVGGNRKSHMQTPGLFL